MYDLQRHRGVDAAEAQMSRKMHVLGVKIEGRQTLQLRLREGKCQGQRSSWCLPDTTVDRKMAAASPSSRLQRLRSSSLSHESLWGSPEAWPLRDEARARVLVLNTGGTIGMGGTESDGGLAPQMNKLVAALKKMPMLHDEEYARAAQLCESSEFADNTLVLPLSKRKKRIIYTILEYSPLLDSCNMTTDDWAKIAKDLETYYEKYDGFVILHGTDTMAYTAAALSFMCENVGKTIVLTGSQVPIYELRNDGRSNLLGALLIAGQFVIPEVCLYFHHKLYRGNRVTKVDTGSFDAFSSPNLPPLANAEVDMKIDWGIVWRANTTKKFEVQTEMNRNVGLLRIFPGITASTVCILEICSRQHPINYQQ
ncbi:60 kDa lysophospholipase [Varanus komodoensis]|nr:60 kDa lysophospholipase [Varanus komodoensis]